MENNPERDKGIGTFWVKWAYCIVLKVEIDLAWHKRGFCIPQKGLKEKEDNFCSPNKQEKEKTPIF